MSNIVQHMTFEEWKAWRQRQPGPTCDYIGCSKKVVWKLPRQGFHYCEEHGGVERLKSLYDEKPIRLGEGGAK
ncbi:hypothetical protein ES703_122336 [subsurface metagenome]